MELKILNNKFKVARLKVGDTIPEIILKQEFYSITKTDEELSIVLD